VIGCLVFDFGVALFMLFSMMNGLVQVVDVDLDLGTCDFESPH